MTRRALSYKDMTSVCANVSAQVDDLSALIDDLSELEGRAETPGVYQQADRAEVSARKALIALERLVKRLDVLQRVMTREVENCA